MVICLERGADLHMAQLMPLPLTVSCFSKIQIGFTLPFWYRLNRVVPEKGLLSGCVCVIYRVPRWWIGERPPDMVASCNISGCPHPMNKQPRTMQPQSHQSVEVVSGWHRSLSSSIHTCSTSILRHGESEPPLC